MCWLQTELPSKCWCSYCRTEILVQQKARAFFFLGKILISKKINKLNVSRNNQTSLIGSLPIIFLGKKGFKVGYKQQHCSNKEKVKLTYFRI